jgi:hypothetical protein
MTKINRIQKSLKITYEESIFLLKNKIDEILIKLNIIKTDDINMINIIEEQIESYKKIKELIQKILINQFLK